MTKAKVNFEIDEQLLARAQSFATRRRVSLSKLVTGFLASLGNESQGSAAPSKTQKVLAEVAVGKVSLTDAARELGLHDAGFLLHMMKEEGLPLPRLEPSVVKAQAEASFDALLASRLPPPRPKAAPRKKTGGKRTATV